MAIERVDIFPSPHKFTVEEYLAFEKRSEFKHEFIDGAIYDWGDPLPGAPVHPDYVPGYPRPHLFTVEEYLAFEAESETKHEFIDGVIYDMAGGTLNHSRIKIHMTVALELQLRDSNCTVCNSDMRVGLDLRNYVYPDLSVFCGEAQLTDDNLTLLNPVAVFEVLSPSSAGYDRHTKLAYYRALPSLQTYIIVDQHQVYIELHQRASAGWLRQSFSDIDAVIPLGSLGCRLPLAEMYRGIIFPDY